MPKFDIGDIVVRKSYGGDVPFKIVGVENVGEKTIYRLQGLMYRLLADSTEEDLERKPGSIAYLMARGEINRARMHAAAQFRAIPPLFGLRARIKPGTVLHIDSSRELMDICLKMYKEKNIRVIAELVDENRQPSVVGSLVERYHPDILIMTGHDALKKGGNWYSMDSYRNSRYFVEGVKIARKIESNMDKMCIFAGACQSYYEAIMYAGANFASSPGRILINGADPGFVGERVALTESSKFVTPAEIAKLAYSGSKGVGGINTRGKARVL